ncbi:MAG: Nif3-like dinuclear metal center hexameric protein, partial [Oscillospiraceae bacterium]|nr:Nif3-like dinuclear metal center hexameric protein [Oscillospiraceae bacterium]
MTITQLYAELDMKYPIHTAYPGDVDGLQLCFDAGREVRRVLLTLDITTAAAEYAVAGGFDTIVAHHALIRTPLTEITPHCLNGDRIIALCRGLVNTISLHTR